MTGPERPSGRAADAPEAAPFFAEVADAPEEARAFWVTALDGMRLRVTLLARGEAGTVLLFPGRTEYAEKYGRVARDLAARGLAVVTVDWRGQGLSARLLEDAGIGHVVAFRRLPGRRRRHSCGRPTRSACPSRGICWRTRWAARSGSGR